MAQGFVWGNDRLSLDFSIDENGAIAVEKVAAGDVEAVFPRRLPLAELLVAGTGHWIADDRLIHTSVGRELRYESHEECVDAANHRKRLDVVLRHPELNLKVTVSYELPDDVAMLRTHVAVRNEGPQEVYLESVTSLVASFGAPEGKSAGLDGWTLTEGDYDWLGEGRWHAVDVRGLFPVLAQELTGHDPRSEHRVVSTGTWSTGKHTPLAVLENKELGLTWLFQIEHNGAWRYEVGDNTVDGYFALSGPTNVDHSWSKTLASGEEFDTVPASVALASDFQSAVDQLTAYRRAMRAPHSDNAVVRTVFNDYMNTINGDPTTAKLLPLIEAASKTGVEIFVIDCGWYDDSGDWWPSVGEWMPSKTRFPGEKGIVEVIDSIKDHGMVPGIWLEPEVIGVKSPMADKLPDSAFFQRNGRRLVEQQRYILDLRDPAARAHLDSVVDRLVDDYGIGYFKMDYNVSPGAGTDLNADAPGDGLLGHNRAYSAWVEGIHRRHPEVILENCSSGGMREDFAQTSRFQVQSTSDQQDYRLYPAIAAAAPMMMLPEQAASWAYPQSDMTAEQTAFNINTTFLGRFFLSGYINRMDPAQLGIVTAGIKAYKEHVQPVIGGSEPFWPLGLPGWDDKVLALGVKAADRTLVTVWAREAEGGEVRLAMPHLAGRAVEVAPVFPVGGDFADWPVRWDETAGELIVTVPAGAGYVSRTFELR